ncbi:hypothetical protein AUK40_02195 [Candidatus Wirthbacteria bacterium CG2_30_54_11]|uniref:Hexokinase n=1 Tax=Candidatus Wirthbacteria bacterium CG2_30_54_11 TaxID=1817892 RepID=A0A1J5J377_9BACT|nr:MAG: hypothetical protein AUK40_02195 [Candidatus Wirthbacteria bacterium CG2_30_54_11]
MRDTLFHDQILWDLRDQSAVGCLRREAERFAEAMRMSGGRTTDIPRMYWSGLADEAESSRDEKDFPDANILVVSVGGSHTHFRALKISRGVVQELVNPGGKRNIPTPCGDEQIHSLEEMLLPIAREACGWLRVFAGGVEPHILLNWGFPQRSIVLSPSEGVTGAIGEVMTKGQRGVQAQGMPIHSVFRACLQQECLLGGGAIDISRVKITVQNDTIMAMFRYLERQRRADFHAMALMILGTGVNLTTLARYEAEENGSVRLDHEGLPVRVPNTKMSAPSRTFWLDYEVGRLKPIETLGRCDRLAPNEQGEAAEDIENFGLGGTGFGRIFHNLVHDYLPEPDLLWSSLASSMKVTVSQFFPDGEWVVKLSGRHPVYDASETISDLTASGLGSEVISSLQVLAEAVVERSAARAGVVLAAVSLFSGLGLQVVDLPDALAMEGSVWKTRRYQDQVLQYWNAILAPELASLKLKELNISLIVEDNYNAGVLGPAYLLGQYL